MITGAILRDGILSGAHNLSNRRASVDELNVFPVPDGDTGTNMSMTIGAAVAELQALPDDCTVEAAAKVTASAKKMGVSLDNAAAALYNKMKYLFRPHLLRL